MENKLTNCRIGKVKLKTGGAPIHILNSQNPDNNYALRILRDCIDIAATENVMSISICLETDQMVYTPFAIDQASTYTAALGALKRMEHRIMESWMNTKS